MRKGVIIPVLIIILWVAGCFSGQKDIDLNPSIRYAGNVLYIKNNDSFDYDEVKVGLNDDAYRFTIEDPIPADMEVRFDLARFSKTDGERFNVLSHSIKDISISCKAIKRKDKFDMDYLGKGFYHGKFKN